MSRVPWRWLALLLFLLPLLWALLASVNIVTDGRGAWHVVPSLEHYHAALTGTLGLAEATVQGLLVSLGAALIAVALAFPAAVGLRRVRSGWAQHGPALLLLVSLMPPLAYGTALEDEAKLLGVFDSPPALAVILGGLGLPLALWVLAGYLAHFPREVEEAAALDGCSVPGAAWRIFLPAAWPAVLATLVVVFVLSWNRFDVPSLLSFDTIKTVPMVLSSFVSYELELDWPSAAAVLIVGMLPALVAVLVAQRALRAFTPLLQDETER